MFIKLFNLLSLKQFYACLLAVLYFATTSISYASQESASMAKDSNIPIVKNDFEWQFMLDLSLANEPIILADIKKMEAWDYFQLGLLLDISYKGFFLQTNSRRSSTALAGGEFGYQLTVQKNWQLDIILKAYLKGYQPAEIIKGQDKDIPQLSGLADRNTIGGIALRYSQFFDHAIFYIDVARASAGKDSQGDNINGIIIDSFYSYLLPYRNWDIYVGAGLSYYQQALIDYAIGINADEVTASRPLYVADSSYRVQLEVYAQYPLSQSWSFNAGITQSFYSSSIKQSPLVDKNMLTQLMLGVLYVF